MNEFRSLFLLSLVLSFAVILGGCGKKPVTKQARETTSPQIGTSELERVLERQTISCSSGMACPGYLSKLVIVNRGKITYCTGFLVNDNTVATSASCLPDLLRRNKIDCSKDIFFFFPQMPNRPAERVGCKEVVQVSQNYDRDPVLWRDDVAFLAVDNSLPYRRQARINRNGILNNVEYSTWYVDQVDQDFGIIRREKCEALQRTYINPLSSNESSPNLVFANCLMKSGKSGAPIIDSRGQVRAMVSSGVSPSVREYLANSGLLAEPLKEMFHATNFACAPTIFDSDMLDERECMKDMTALIRDDLRSEHLSMDNLFKDMRIKLETNLDTLSQYLNLGVRFITRGDIQEAAIYPKCFKPMSGWLSSLNGTRNNYVFELSLPVVSFKRTMNAYGRVQGEELSSPSKKYFFQFSLRSIRSFKESRVFMWNSEQSQSFPEISENCESVD